MFRRPIPDVALPPFANIPCSRLTLHSSRSVCSRQAAAGPDAKIIRVMPNTPCLVSAAAAAMCKGAKVWKAPSGLSPPSTFYATALRITFPEGRPAARDGVKESAVTRPWLLEP
jgi:hypothetical protein